LNPNTISLLAPYITLIAGILVAYLTFRNQLRLKSFELLLKRREEILNDIEKEIELLQLIKVELKTQDERPHLDRFLSDYFHNGLILFHKMKGANFGGVSKHLIATYWSISNELITKNNMTESEIRDYVQRMLNTLSAIYGFAHSKVNAEIEMITLPWYLRFFRKVKNIILSCKNWITMKKRSRKMK
jgi:hypothetical protein